MATGRAWSHVSPLFAGIVVGCVQPAVFVLLFLFGGMVDSSLPAPVWGLVAWWVLGFPLLDLVSFGPLARMGAWTFALCFVLDAIIWGSAASAIAFGLQRRARTIR
jgi:hypothetical protein